MVGHDPPPFLDTAVPGVGLLKASHHVATRDDPIQRLAIGEKGDRTSCSVPWLPLSASSQSSPACEMATAVLYWQPIVSKLTTQPVLALAAEDRDVLEAVHVADGHGQCNEKDFSKEMPCGRTLVGIGELPEGVQPVGETFTIAILFSGQAIRLAYPPLQKLQRLFESYVRLP